MPPNRFAWTSWLRWQARSSCRGKRNSRASSCWGRCLSYVADSYGFYSEIFPALQQSFTVIKQHPFDTCRFDCDRCRRDCAVHVCVKRCMRNSSDQSPACVQIPAGHRIREVAACGSLLRNSLRSEGTLHRSARQIVECRNRGRPWPREV